jgi:tRNA(Arg) A34 adenosine deaminase TadA
MKKQLLNKILEVSRRRLRRHPEINNFPHYSYIVKNGKIVTWARNCKKEPPVHYGYHRPWDETYRPKYHAELAAFKKALVKPPFQIVNVRMNKQGLLRISKPCSACTKLMTALGCTKFYYSFQEGFLEYSPNDAE